MDEKRQRKTPNAFGAEGAAAYDVRYEGNLRQQPTILPEEQEKLVRVRRVKARMTVSPFSVLGIAAAVFLAVLVIFGYVRLYEADSNLSTLQNELSDLQSEQGKLQNTYEEQVNLASIEQQALALGMHQPKSSQTVYVNLTGLDRAEITPAEHKNVFGTVYSAIRDSILDFVEYLS
ncbi:MAG: hypothetical protein VB055_08290 [Oscillospiraceae bacterium]|nr:hypothetical protein [Oscillospiraceae bacterium]